MTLRMQSMPGLLIGALLMAALMMLAVACGTKAAEDTPAEPPADTPTEAAPELGNRVGNLAPDFTITTTSGVTRVPLPISNRPISPSSSTSSQVGDRHAGPSCGPSRMCTPTSRMMSPSSPLM